MNEVVLQTFSYFDTGKNPSEEEPERFYHGFVPGMLNMRCFWTDTAAQGMSSQMSFPCAVAVSLLILNVFSIT